MSPSSEAPFEASVLNDHENNTLRAGSLLAVPPPPSGSQPLAGSMTVDLLGNSLTQWATHMQDVTSGMILPPEVSYAVMVSSTETTASTSEAGITPLSYPPPGMPPLEPMDTLPAPTLENLLATAGVSRGSRGQRQPSTPTAPGLHQTRPMAPQQQMPTPRRQGTNQATPYRQQVVPTSMPQWSSEQPPLNKVLPLAPVRAALRQPEKAKMPEVSLHPEGLKVDTGKTDPPPEDPGNAGKAPQVTIPWMRCLTTWPQDGNKTSHT